ncbi:MAG: chemotaxis protein CheX [Pseudomonadota bacterium]
MINSKVIVHDDDEAAVAQIKSFLQEHNIIGLRAKTWEVIKTLKENIDLGAIIISNTMLENNVNGIEIAERVHEIRSELPIFMRIDQDSEKQLTEKHKELASGFFHLDNLSELKALLDNHIFNAHYPEAFIEGVQDITQTAISSVFKEFNVRMETPTVVRDQFVYGELFSLIALESDWGRGYMMVQAEEEAISRAIEKNYTAIHLEQADFRDVNQVLNEITNLIWGGLKSRFMQSYVSSQPEENVQVPTLINHARHYISFGTMNPQLSFRYHLTNDAAQLYPITILQKFIFNLHWSPEKFAVSESAIDSGVESGELELW